MAEDNPYRPPSTSIRPPAAGPTRSKLGILGTDAMSDEDLARELEAGGRFVAFDYCISAFVVTFRRSSPIYFIRVGEVAAFKGVQYTLLSLIAGWWGYLGPLYTPVAIFVNCSGGRDVTHRVVADLLRWDELRAIKRYFEGGTSPAVGAPFAPDPGAAGPDGSVPEVLKGLDL